MNDQTPASSKSLPIWLRLGLGLYDALWVPVALGWSASALARHGRAALPELVERAGDCPHRPVAVDRSIWFHAVSVGELLSIRPLIREWKHRHPSDWVVVTTSHPAADRLARDPATAADAVSRVPWDHSRAVRRFLDRARPDLLAIVECEIWPHMVLETRQRSAPVAMVNARVYARDFPRYRKFRSIFGPLLRRMPAILAQSDADRERFLVLGADAPCVRTVGNTKFDVALPADATERLERLRSFLPIGAGPIWAWASTHAPEERELLQASRQLWEAWPDLQIIIAPRHVERAAALIALANERGLSARRRSECTRSAEKGHIPQVLVLDTIGELAVVLGLADCVFVGGSLAPKGGQNPIEPALWGKAIVAGPSMFNFAAVMDTFMAHEGAAIAPDAAGVVGQVHRWLENENERDRIGQNARAMARRHQGVVLQIADELETLLRQRQSDDSRWAA